MKILEYILEQEKTYGKNGDGSLEYVGVTVNENGILKKLYRKHLHGVSIYEIPLYKKVIERYFSKFIIEENVEICDYSESMSDDIPVYRIVFKFSKNLSILSYRRCLESFFVNLEMDDVKKEIDEIVGKCTKEFGFDHSPLLQIGIEFDSRGTVLGVKYYIDLKVSKYKKVAASRELVCKIKKVLFSDTEKSEDELDRLIQTANFDYSPIFAGVNVCGELCECKVYLISGYLGYSDRELLRNTQEMISAMGWTSILCKEDLAKLYERSLFIEGIAYTLNSPNEYRLYFNYLPRRK